MIERKKLTITIGILFILLAIVSGIAAEHKKVLLKDVKTIILTEGKFTTGRRSSPVAQLQCMGGTAGCKEGTPKTVQCTQSGFDGNDATWECKADLDNEYRFGKLEVTCEGYDYPEDPYILAGSCGLEYQLDYTSAKQNQNYGGGYGGYGRNYNYGSYSDNGGSSSLFSIIFCVIIFYILYTLCYGGANGQEGGNGGGNGGGYGGGYGGNNGGNNGGGGGGGGGGPQCGPSPSYAAPHVNNGGFWNGMLTGGLLGYMFGGPRRYPGYGAGYGYGAAPYGGYGGGFGGPRFGGGGGGFGGGFGGGGSRMGAGFGGTRRR